MRCAAVLVLLLAAIPICAGAGPSPKLIVVHTPNLRPAAQAWADYRHSPAGGSWDTVLHEIDPALKPADQADATVRFLTGGKIREAHVLLLGDASELATFHLPQPDPQLISSDADRSFATDQPYQLPDDRGVPRLALGRVPVRTVEEAQAVLGKIRQYESRRDDAPAASARRRITYVASEGHFGVMDGLFEALFIRMVDRMVPDEFDLSMTYAKPSSIYCPPPSKLNDTVLQRLGEGSLLFNYVGHGHPTALDTLRWGNQRLPILRATDLSRLVQFRTDTSQRPVAFLACCSTGFFDLPNGKRSLAEEMLLHPHGPIAVIAASRVSHPYANAAMQMQITRSLFADRAPTAGMLDRLASRSLLASDSPLDRELDLIAAPIAAAGKWKCTLPQLREMHAAMYNLLGDPATRLALPDVTIDAAISGNRLTATIPNMKSGKVTITLETVRATLAFPTKILPGDDTTLELRAANNYPLANDRVLLRFESDVTDGRFDVTLPNPPPDRAATARFVANGIDAQDHPVSAIGACRIPRPATPTTQPAPLRR